MNIIECAGLHWNRDPSSTSRTINQSPGVSEGRVDRRIIHITTNTSNNGRVPRPPSTSKRDGAGVLKHTTDRVRDDIGNMCYVAKHCLSCIVARLACEEAWSVRVATTTTIWHAINCRFGVEGGVVQM